LAACSTKSSTAELVYEGSSGESDTYSSMTEKRDSGPATTRSRKKSEPFSAEFAIRT
jgi:hypothetical protein